MNPLRLRFGVRKPPPDPHEAAEWWLARRRLGLLQARDEAAFQTWSAEPANAAAYARLEAAVESAGAYAAEPEILQIRASALAMQPAAHAGRAQIAAAVVGLVLVGGAAAVWASAALTGQVAATASGVEAANGAVRRFATAIGEHRRVDLDDGSAVLLNTGSLIEVAFTGQRRAVRLLRGEALFHVAHNPHWPFVVAAGDRQVTAVGTAFDVRLDGPALKVVLIEGKVRVDPLRPRGIGRLIPQLAEEQLTRGEQLVAHEGVEASAVATTDPERAISWKDGQVVFRDDTLGSAVAELNRYSERRILAADPSVAALRVSGVFDTSRPENFVAAVTTFYPLKARQTAAGVTELVWRDRG